MSAHLLDMGGCVTPVASGLSSRPPCLPVLSGLGGGLSRKPPGEGCGAARGRELDWVGRSSASQRTTEELGQGGGETQGQFSALASVPGV